MFFISQGSVIFSFLGVMLFWGCYLGLEASFASLFIIIIVACLYFHHFSSSYLLMCFLFGVEKLLA
jgi:hypothetical protein